MDGGMSGAPCFDFCCGLSLEGLLQIHALRQKSKHGAPNCEPLRNRVRDLVCSDSATGQLCDLGKPGISAGFYFHKCEMMKLE